MSDPSRARFVMSGGDTKLWISVNFDLRKHETLIKGGDPEVLYEHPVQPSSKGPVSNLFRCQR